MDELEPTPAKRHEAVAKTLTIWLVLTGLSVLALLTLFQHALSFFGVWVWLHPMLLNPLLAVVIAFAAGPAAGVFWRRLCRAGFVLTAAWIAAIAVGSIVRSSTSRVDGHLYLPSLPRSVPVTLLAAMGAHVVTALLFWVALTWGSIRRVTFRPLRRSMLLVGLIALIVPIAWFAPVSRISLLKNWSFRDTAQPTPALDGVHALFLAPGGRMVRHWNVGSGVIVDLVALDKELIPGRVMSVDIKDGLVVPLQLCINWVSTNAGTERFEETTIECPALGPAPPVGWEVGRFDDWVPRLTVETALSDLRTDRSAPPLDVGQSFDRLAYASSTGVNGLRVPFFAANAGALSLMSPSSNPMLFGCALYCRHVLDGDLYMAVSDSRIVQFDGQAHVITDVAAGDALLVLVPSPSP